MSACKHMNFKAHVAVARVEDIGRFMADVQIECADCGTKMQFMGMEPGMSYEKPMVNPDATEARLPICPVGQRPNPMQEMLGFTLNKFN